MKAIITIEFTIDRRVPDTETLNAAIQKMISETNYIGSEQVDGTDEWGLEIGNTTVSISDANNLDDGRPSETSDSAPMLPTDPRKP